MNAGEMAEYVADVLQTAIDHDTTSCLKNWEVVGLDIGEIIITNKNMTYRLNVTVEKT